MRIPLVDRISSRVTLPQFVEVSGASSPNEAAAESPEKIQQPEPDRDRGFRDPAPTNF